MENKNIKEIRMKEFEPIPKGHEGKWVAWVDYKFVASEDTLDKLYKRLGKKKEKATVFKVPEGLLVI